MLSVLRKNAGSWIIKILLFAIVAVFCFWGVGRFGDEQRATVATVNGKTISFSEFNEAYINLREQTRQRFGNDLSGDMINALQLKRQALNQLIDQRLLKEEAARLSLRVSDDELSESILNIGAFQSAGIFNARLYQNILSQNRLTPEKFEAIQRDTLLINKLRSYTISGAKVSDKEAEEYYRWQNASVNIDSVLFEPRQYEGILPTVEEIAVYYEDNKTVYKTEPRIKVRYLNFESKAYALNASVTEEDMQSYYDNNLEQFETPKTVDARHILLKVDPGVDPEIIEKIKQKALDIQKIAQEGRDFAVLAKEYSEGPTKDVGGKLEPFTRESMEKPFSDKAFSMQPDDISEPVRTRYGWHIIKVEGINEESIRSIDEVRDDIRDTLALEKGKELAFDAVQMIYDVSFEGDDLIKAAEANNLSILTTDYFTQKDPDRAIKRREQFASAAFGLSEMEISNILDHDDGYYILQVIEKKPEAIPELNNVSDRVRMDLIIEKQDEKAKQEAEDFLAALKNSSNIDDESKKLGLTPDSTGFFKRNDPIPEIGYEREIVQAAFELSGDIRTPELVLKGNKGYYVIWFKERKEPTDDGFDNQRDGIKKNLLQQKQQRTFDATLTHIRDNSVILIEEQFLD